MDDEEEEHYHALDILLIGGTLSDAFTKREKAAEDYYVRQQEKAKLV